MADSKEKGAANDAKELKDAKKEAKAPKVEKKTDAKPKAEGKKEAKAAKAEAPKSASPEAVANAWTVIKSAYLTEKSTHMIESQNKLVFIVAERATKTEIKKAVEAAFSVKVSDVNTTSTMRGEKKAYVRLAPEFKAIDVATKLGMM